MQFSHLVWLMKVEAIDLEFGFVRFLCRRRVATCFIRGLGKFQSSLPPTKDHHFKVSMTFMTAGPQWLGAVGGKIFIGSWRWAGFMLFCSARTAEAALREKTVSKKFLCVPFWVFPPRWLARFVVLKPARAHFEKIHLKS